LKIIILIDTINFMLLWETDQYPFEGENYRGFHGFLLTVNVLPLKIFLEYIGAIH